MIEHWNINQTFEKTDSWQPGCWTRIVDPSANERHIAMRNLGIPEIFINYMDDADERARYDSEEGWKLIVVRMPYAKAPDSSTPYITVPFGIVMKDNILATISNFHIPMIEEFIKENTDKKTGFIDFVDLIFHFFFYAAIFYLKYLRKISQKIEKAKQALDDNIDNSSLIALSRLQDSLTYFVTSIQGNESLLNKLESKLPIDKLDSDLIEDINIELSQAKETSQIYSTILDSTMDTYSSVINNNVNTVMRVLASVSIILMIPTLIASFLGMNLRNGLENMWWGLLAVFVFSIVVTFICWLVFKHKKLI